MNSVTLQGKCAWARLIHVNKYGNWSMRLYFDAPSLDKFKSLQDIGILTRLHKDEENQYYADFKRLPSKEYKDKFGASKKINFTPPIVLQRDGTSLHKDEIGNGSDVTLELEIYQYTIPTTGGKKGKALRIHSVRVDNLIPFIPTNDLTVKEKEAIAGINAVPPQPEF